MPTLMAVSERNALADLQASRITELSLHTTSPGITGANEATGGTPVYAKKPVVFTAAGAVGVLGTILQPATVGVAWSNEVVFDVPANTYTHWGAWGVGSVYRIGNDILPAAQSPTSQAQIRHSIGVGGVVGI